MEYKKPLSYCITRDVKEPAYGTPHAGCIDFFVPQFDDQFMEDFAKKNPRFSPEEISVIKKTGKVELEHGFDICIPSGIHARLEPNTALTAFNKSGVATKLRLIRGAEYVDCDYMGEIHLHVINAGHSPVTVEQGMKIVQFSYVPVFTGTLERKATKEELYEGFDLLTRGENWQGSTGTK